MGIRGDSQHLWRSHYHLLQRLYPHADVHILHIRGSGLLLPSEALPHPGPDDPVRRGHPADLPHALHGRMRQPGTVFRDHHHSGLRRGADCALLSVLRQQLQEEARGQEGRISASIQSVCEEGGRL